jgi:hypothetical protein
VLDHEAFAYKAIKVKRTHARDGHDANNAASRLEQSFWALL